MISRILIQAFLLFVSITVTAQKQDFYTREIKAYQKNYVATHEVVQQKDKKHFHFFRVSDEYNVTCSFDRIMDTVGFTMTTSAKTLKHYYTYGQLHFIISGQACILYVYQSKDLMENEKYRDYLFVPFTDATTGDETYGSGRYLEFYIKDIVNNTLQLDFNKAYNPYCAYATGYKCPVPPKENRLTVAVRAGEKNFGKTH
ncbi:MAG: DUF1684 domain-containing protein [Chitinophagaceae bacterium]|nr:DUF1684 domain-containing protein [Chitinophagaceae bacterium]